FLVIAKTANEMKINGIAGSNPEILPRPKGTSVIIASANRYNLMAISSYLNLLLNVCNPHNNTTANNISMVQIVMVRILFVYHAGIQSSSPNFIPGPALYHIGIIRQFYTAGLSSVAFA
ncbi:hypothetical protein, partial [Klebsiella aerogenes]|uniref:hypothetical protein n=3 Tax=Klebsiella aerogenes TaxID=548 RepID=UPI0013791907